MKLVCRLATLIVFAWSAGDQPANGEPEPGGARAFIERVYAEFPEKPNAASAGPAFRALFDPGLAALIKRDEETTPSGDVGALDFDPICGCQDSDGFQHRLTSVTGSSVTATVKVENRFVAPAAPSFEIVTYRLDRVNGSWRIADIMTAKMPSFRAWLAQNLKGGPRPN